MGEQKTIKAITVATAGSGNIHHLLIEEPLTVQKADNSCVNTCGKTLFMGFYLPFTLHFQ